MSNKTHAKVHQLRQQKRAEFSKPVRRNSNLVLWVLIMGLLGVVGYLVVGRFQSAPTTVTASAKTIQITANAMDVRVPLSDVSNGQAKFFEASLANNTTVRFFVIKTSDGVYRAALDACEVCYGAGKGYHQDGDQMVCRKCGRHFSVNTVNNGTTGCHPIGLTRTVDGSDLLIKASELESGSHYF